MNNEENNFETLKDEIEKLKKDVYEKSIEGVNRSIKHINTSATIIGIVIVVIGILGGYTMIDATRVKGELREDVKDMKETIRYETESMRETLKEETKKAGESRERIETIKAEAERASMEIEGKSKEMVELVGDARTILAETARKKEAAEEAARISLANRYFIEGINLAGFRMWEDAIEKYKLAVELDQGFEAAYHSWGLALYWVWKKKKENRYLEDALQKLEKVIEINENNDVAWYDKASAHFLLKDKKNTLQSLRKAIELDVKYKEEAKKDEIFKELWDDEDFKKLVE